MILNIYAVIIPIYNTAILFTCFDIILSSILFYCTVIGIVDSFNLKIAEQPEGVAHPAAENPGGTDGSENQTKPPEF